MKLIEVDKLSEELNRFCDQFSSLFKRREGREQIRKYLQGLLLVDRKNGWQLAEAVGDTSPDATQRLLYSMRWDADEARNQLQHFVCSTFADPEGIGIVIENAFPKKGNKSAGVERQYNKAMRRTENCQIGVFLTYATKKGHTFIDRRLYLSESWCEDMQRRREAKIPDRESFESKPTLAIKMLQHAWSMGILMKWVTGDRTYGISPELRHVIASQGRWYVLEVPSHARVWLERPNVSMLTWQEAGAHFSSGRMNDKSRNSLSVEELVASWGEIRWQTLTLAEVGENSKTESRIYDWAYQRIFEDQDSKPIREAWLVARRSIQEPQEIVYYFSNAPTNIALSHLAKIASAYFISEECFQEGKGYIGLNHYEVRHWHSWYRYITLSMMAHAWSASVHLTEST